MKRVFLLILLLGCDNSPQPSDRPFDLDGIADEGQVGLAGWGSEPLEDAGQENPDAAEPLEDAAQEDASEADADVQQPVGDAAQEDAAEPDADVPEADPGLTCSACGNGVLCADGYGCTGFRCYRESPPNGDCSIIPDTHLGGAAYCVPNDGCDAWLVEHGN